MISKNAYVSKKKMLSLIPSFLVNFLKNLIGRAFQFELPERPFQCICFLQYQKLYRVACLQLFMDNQIFWDNHSNRSPPFAQFRLNFQHSYTNITKLYKSFVSLTTTFNAQRAGPQKHRDEALRVLEGGARVSLPSSVQSPDECFLLWSFSVFNITQK